jgi:hypothetical protein
MCGEIEVRSNSYFIYSFGLNQFTMNFYVDILFNLYS